MKATTFFGAHLIYIQGGMCSTCMTMIVRNVPNGNDTKGGNNAQGKQSLMILNRFETISILVKKE